MGKKQRHQQQQKQPQQKLADFKAEVERQSKQISGEPCYVRVVYIEQGWKFMHVCDRNHEISAALTEAAELGIRKLCEETGIKRDALSYGPSIGIMKSPTQLYRLDEWTRNGFLMVYTAAGREDEGLLGKLQAAENQLNMLEQEGSTRKSSSSVNNEKSKGKKMMEDGNKIVEGEHERALQGLKQENESLKKQVSELENRVELLEKDFEALKQVCEGLRQDYQDVFRRLRRFGNFHRRIVINEARKKAAEAMDRAPEHNETWSEYFDAVAPPPGLSEGLLRLLKEGGSAGNWVAHEVDLADSVCEAIKDRSYWIEAFKFAYNQDPEQILSDADSGN